MSQRWFRTETPKPRVISCICSQLPRPFRRLAAGPECIDPNGRSEREHRLWPIPSPHSYQSIYIYWTHFSQATYLQNILTLKWHFSDGQVRRKLPLFEACFCLGKQTLARSGNTDKLTSTNALTKLVFIMLNMALRWENTEC